MARLLSLPFIVALSWLLIYRIRRWAERRRILDVPNQRSSHSQPTPHGGGLAIVVLAVSGLLVYGSFFSGQWSIILPYIAGALLIAAVSWIDDLRSLPSQLRLGAHCLSAIVAIVSFGAWDTVSLPVVGPLQLGEAGVLVTLFWITGLTNVYNFMDGIDGIAGGQAVIAACGWAALGWYSGQPIVTVTGFLLAAVSIGFLAHNWSPARIFMGDVGSAFLGYTFAVLPVIAARSDSRMPLAGVILVWPFLFDATLTLLRRLSRGENVFAAHRSHLYQRLIIVGYSHRFVSSLYIGLALVGGVLALAWFTEVPAAQLAIAGILPLLCLSLWGYVVREERRCSRPAPNVVAVGERSQEI